MTLTALPGLGLSVELAGVWRLDERPTTIEGLGVFLVHAPTSIYLNVRQFGPGFGSIAALEREFAGYAGVSWPGAPRVTSWVAGALLGLTGVFEEAMPDRVVREWLVTDGHSTANAATFATEQEWTLLLPDCEALMRSVRFEAR